jgi:exodeoxyribonuclease III
MLERGGTMRIITWNVNGLRACLSKGFIEFVDKMKPDIICVQETKMQPEQADISIPGYEIFWNSAVKKGYSGTACFSKIHPIAVTYDIGIEEHSKEGRTITLEFDEFFLVNVYTPNAQEKLARLDYRMTWETDFKEYVKKLDVVKPVIVCGDLNVAHNEIDLKNPGPNRGNAGFSDQEREKMSELLASGFIDSFRYKYPDTKEAYTWWSYRFNARTNNAGWRIDYFIISERLMPWIQDQVIHADVMGSDHCPVELVTNL